MAIGWFEGGDSFTSIPEWVRWFIQLGLHFPTWGDGKRRLLLISTPCDAPAAALVSLGIVARDLAREDATDAAHYAREFRHWAKKQLAKQEDERKKIFHLNSRRPTNCVIDSFDANGTLTLREMRGKKEPVIWKFGPNENPEAVLLHFVPDGWSRPKGPEGGELPDMFFAQLTPDWKPVGRNLRESYSGACLAGRLRGGEEGTKEYLNAFGFMLPGTTGGMIRIALGSTLTISGWGSYSVSRLRYCNTRGADIGRFDTRGTAIDIIVADGADESVKVLRKLHSRNVIAVVRRDADAQKIEALSQSLEDRKFVRMAREEQPNANLPPNGVTLDWRVKE